MFFLCSAIECPRFASFSRIWGIRPDAFWSSTRSFLFPFIGDAAAVSIPSSFEGLEMISLVSEDLKMISLHNRFLLQPYCEQL